MENVSEETLIKKEFSMFDFYNAVKKYITENILGLIVLGAALFIVYIQRIANYIFGGDTIEAMSGNLANDRINIGRIGGYLIERLLLLDKFNPQFITFMAVVLLFLSAVLWGSLISIWGGTARI